MKTILKWILNQYGMRVWIGFTWLMTGSSGGSCKHGNETSIFIIRC
jgi:hypothetical protein